MVVWLIDVIKHFFGGHLDLPETKKLKNSFVLMHEPSKNVKTFHGFFVCGQRPKDLVIT